MKHFLILKQLARTSVLATLVVALVAAVLTTALPANGQAALTRADSVVLVNSD